MENIVPTERAMIHLPKNSVKITITATIYENDELVSVSSDLDLSKIRKAFADAEKNYIEDEDCFTLTNRGKKKMEEFKDSDRAFSVWENECGLCEKNLLGWED